MKIGYKKIIMPNSCLMDILWGPLELDVLESLYDCLIGRSIFADIVKLEQKSDLATYFDA